MFAMMKSKRSVGSTGSNSFHESVVRSEHLLKLAGRGASSDCIAPIFHDERKRMFPQVFHDSSIAQDGWTRSTPTIANGNPARQACAGVAYSWSSTLSSVPKKHLNTWNVVPQYLDLSDVCRANSSTLDARCHGQSMRSACAPGFQDYAFVSCTDEGSEKVRCLFVASRITKDECIGFVSTQDMSTVVDHSLWIIVLTIGCYLRGCPCLLFPATWSFLFAMQDSP